MLLVAFDRWMLFTACISDAACRYQATTVEKVWSDYV